MLGHIADLKTMPDADIPYLTNLETMVLGYLRAPFEAQQQSSQMSAPPGGAPMGAPPGGPPMANLVPGVHNGASMPPADELRRLLSAG